MMTSTESELYLTGLIAIAIAVLIVVLLEGCSGDVMRMGGKADLSPAPMSRDAERDHIVGEGKDFCARYSDDVACRGLKK